MKNAEYKTQIKQIIVNLKAWAKELRSGKYEQTDGALCIKTEDGFAFCCLGVQMEMLNRSDISRDDSPDVGEKSLYCMSDDNTSNFGHIYHEYAEFTPSSVDEFFFGDYRLKKFLQNEGFALHESLYGSYFAELNDKKHFSFVQIAEEIDDLVKGLKEFLKNKS